MRAGNALSFVGLAFSPCIRLPQAQAPASPLLPSMLAIFLLPTWLPCCFGWCQVLAAHHAVVQAQQAVPAPRGRQDHIVSKAHSGLERPARHLLQTNLATRASSGIRLAIQATQQAPSPVLIIQCALHN